MVDQSSSWIQCTTSVVLATNCMHFSVLEEVKQCLRGKSTDFQLQKVFESVHNAVGQPL